jgi:hypothetical protein
MRDHDDDHSGRGARFVIRSGDTQLRVVCSGEESTQACVDAAVTLFERVQPQRNPRPGNPPPVPEPGSPSPPRFQ